MIVGNYDTGGPEQGIYVGDCVKLSEGLPDNSIGMIITSPPYNVGLQYVEFDDNLEHEEFVNFNARWLSCAYRILADTGRIYIVVSDRMTWWIKPLAEKCGFTYVQRLVWCKPNMPGSAGISNDWNYMTEDILLFRKGKRTPMQAGIGTTFNWFLETVPQTNFTGGRIHPAQWPVGLCERIISRTPGDPVLDMFSGSGSALVACKRLGRPALGFEISPTVAEMSRDRIQKTPVPLFKFDEVQETTLFDFADEEA